MDAVILGSSSSSGDIGFFGLVLLAVPFVVGWWTYRSLYRRYRNQDQRYRYEYTTAAVRSRLQRWDTFDRKNNRQRNRDIHGRNDDDSHERADHATVREAQAPRVAQEERLAQEAREAEPAREAQEPRAADTPREPGA